MVYYSIIPQALLGTSITWKKMSSPAVYEIATAPNRSLLHIVTTPELNTTIYTDNTNVTMNLYATTVDINTNGSIETLQRPNGKYPLYINGKIKWTTNYQRYFVDILNNYQQDIFLYISP